MKYFSYITKIRQALDDGESEPDHTAHRFTGSKGKYGQFIFHYAQGDLVNVWHVESGRIWTLPSLLPQLEGRQTWYEKYFSMAVKEVAEERGLKYVDHSGNNSGSGFYLAPDREQT